MLFFKKTPTSSLDQFSKDFGDFPPQPLNLGIKNNKFDVISLSGLSSKYYTISRVSRTLRRNPEKESDPVAKAISQEMRDSITEIERAISKLKNSIGKLPLIRKIAALILFFAIFPLLLVLMVFLSLKLLYSVSKVKSLGTESLGFFSPKTQDNSEIVIKPGPIKKSKILPEAIISHEHIHLMQNACFGESSTENIDADFKINIEKFLKNEHINSKSALYYLSLNEVEARLHEIVISHYKKNKMLPVDYQGFLSLLLACDFLGEYVRSMFLKCDVSFPEENTDNYELREEVPAEDILLMLTFLSDFQYEKRFVCEALSFMYGNLLMIYGDSKKALDYFQTIECQDFYYQIYGNHASPIMRKKDLYESEA